MRGRDHQQSSMFSYLSAEQRVRADHPLRAIRAMTEQVLQALSARFDRLYSELGRPSIAPEKLLRALLLQIFYTIRSERLLMEEIDYSVLYRWFVGFNLDEPVWDVTVFTKNRDRLLRGSVAQEFFQQVLAQARRAALLSDEHFTVDGTLIEAWAGHKSFQRKAGSQPPPGTGPSNPSVDFKGEQRKNDTHQSTTDPQARLYKKAQGREAKLCYLGHVLMENRNGLVVGSRVTQADGFAERTTAVALAAEMTGPRRGRTLAADKAYDTAGCVGALRERGFTPHVAQNLKRPQGSAIDGRTTRHPGYATSQRKRKRVEEIFGWLKTVAGLRKTRLRGVARLDWFFTFAAAAYNLVRMRKLIPSTA
jgi:transposase